MPKFNQFSRFILKKCILVSRIIIAPDYCLLFTCIVDLPKQNRGENYYGMHRVKKHREWSFIPPQIPPQI